jgi:hypothetical protein
MKCSAAAHAPLGSASTCVQYTSMYNAIKGVISECTATAHAPQNQPVPVRANTTAQLQRYAFFCMCMPNALPRTLYTSRCAPGFLRGLLLQGRCARQQQPPQLSPFDKQHRAALTIPLPKAIHRPGLLHLLVPHLARLCAFCCRARGSSSSPS